MNQSLQNQSPDKKKSLKLEPLANKSRIFNAIQSSGEKLIAESEPEKDSNFKSKVKANQILPMGQSVSQTSYLNPDKFSMTADQSSQNNSLLQKN